MKHATLGTLSVGRLGLGCMGMSAFYSGANTDEAESIRTIHRALDLGVTMLDTAEMYGPHTNEVLVGRALAGRRDGVVIATKFGILAGADGGRRLDGRPENVRRSVEGSLQRLGTAEDCAPAYLFLASHVLSGYITGQVLEVNGGQLIC